MDGRTAMLTDIATTADSLTDTFRHAEPIEYWDANRHRKTRQYTTRQKSLLDQLADKAFPGVGDTAVSTGSYESKPPGDLAAISAHTAITIAAAKWCWDLRVDQRDTVASNIRALVGAAGGLDSSQQQKLLADLRRWHRWAAVIAGWETAPHRPAAPCPHCGKRGGDDGGLLVRLESETAVCTSCLTGWGGDGEPPLSELVEFIRDHAARSVAANVAARRCAVEKRRHAEGGTSVAA